MDRNTAMSRGPRLYQKILLVLFGLSLLGVAELCLRLLPDRAGTPDDSFIGFSRLNPLYERYRAADGSGRARTVPAKAKWFNEVDFSVDKPSGTFRIFALGGSTTYGHPYSDPTSFPALLERLLNAGTGDDRRYEVINAGGISYASYRVAVLLDELLGYDPDLVVVLSGHNEFLEARTYGALLEQPVAILETRSLLSRLRLYREIRRVIESMRRSRPAEGGTRAGGEGRSVLAPEVETLLDRSAGLDIYQRDSLFARGVFEHFRFNLQRMINRCREAGVEILFCSPVDNLKDFSPFKSMFSSNLPAEDRLRLAAMLRQAAGALNGKDPHSAAGILEEAAGLDPLYAETFFLLGKARLASGDTARAYPALLLARELDVCPLRAQEPIHAALREESSRAGVDLLDLQALFSSRSPGGIIGDELLLDHIHPSPEGNMMIAAEIAGWMTGRGMTVGYRLPDEEARAEILAAVTDSLPPEYFSQGILNLVKTLTWAKKFDEAQALAAERWDDLAEDGEVWYLRATVLERDGELEAALEHYRTALTLIPGHRQSLTQVARIYEALGRIDEARETYIRALGRHPGDVPLRVNHAIMLARLGEHDRANAEFRKALEIAPDNIEVLNNMGLLLTMQGDLQGAEKHLRRSIEVLPENPQARNYLGLVYMQRGLTTEAEREFSEAVRLNPEHEAARTNLANALLRNGKQDQAEEQLRTALVINPRLAAAWLNLCLLYRDSGREGLFRETLDEALRNCPEDPRLQRLLE